MNKSMAAQWVTAFSQWINDVHNTHNFKEWCVERGLLIEVSYLANWDAVSSKTTLNTPPVYNIIDFEDGSMAISRTLPSEWDMHKMWYIVDTPFIPS